MPTGPPHPGRIDIPVAAYLLELADGRLALVDSGMNRVHATDPDATWRGRPQQQVLTPRMGPEDTLLARLGQLGVDPRDIEVVINTHLHFDHAGNNDLLGRATFYLQRDQYEAARGNPSYPNQYWNLPHLSYELLDGDSDLFDGVAVLATPGHSPGHQSVVVDLPETGAVIVAGDAVFSARNYERDDWSAQQDPAVARDSALRLRALAEARSGLLLYGHDLEQAQTLRWAPGASYL